MKNGLSEDKKKMRVWASYWLQGTGPDVMRAVTDSLDPENEGTQACGAPYFGLSESGEDFDCVGSHFGDDEVSIHLEPLADGWLLVLTGHADGLKKPGITPPLINGEEYNLSFGSHKGTMMQVLTIARKESNRELNRKHSVRRVDVAPIIIDAQTED